MKQKSPPAVPGCYGSFRASLDRCRDCDCRNYCRDSVDPPLLGDYATPVEIESLPAPGKSNFGRRRSYSYDEMLELMGFLLNLDYKTINLLCAKLEAPDLSMAEIADRRKITRQAVHKFIRQRCREVPELACVLLRRKNMTENNRNSTFMEAVCQIQQQRPKTPSSELKLNSNCSNSLICLSRSLDLSRLSIGKDARTSPTD